METINSWPFVSHVIGNETPDLLQGKSIKQFLLEKYESKFGFGLDHLHRSGGVKLMGFYFDFKPYLKRYIVRQYDHLQEYYAPNKTLLRKSIFGRIEYIQELTVKG